MPREDQETQGEHVMLMVSFCHYYNAACMMNWIDVHSLYWKHHVSDVPTGLRERRASPGHFQGCLTANYQTKGKENSANISISIQSGCNGSSRVSMV